MIQQSVLLDGQNVGCGFLFQELINWLSQQGEIYSLMAAYEWEKVPGAFKKACLDFPGVTPIYAPTDKRNRADHYLIDSGDKQVLPISAIKRVILMSSDGDFAPLVKRLKAAGKEVWVIYQTKLSEKLKKAADRCISLQELFSK